jgi:hypothetical protein
LLAAGTGVITLPAFAEVFNSNHILHDACQIWLMAAFS